jgi:hypothetical protein
LEGKKLSNSFICVDIGNSETRFAGADGKVFHYPNNRVVLEQATAPTFKAEGNTITSALEAHIDLVGSNGSYSRKVLYGSLASRHSANNERPSVLEPKHVQDISVTSVLLSVALSRLMADEDTSGLVDIYIAVPPVEVEKASDTNEKARAAFTKLMEGKVCTVFFPKLNRTITFEIGSVHCYEESFMATLAFFFDEHCDVRKGAEDFLTGNVLSIDIGASTTDLVVVQDGSYLEHSGRTYQAGGNLVRENLIEVVQREFGVELPVRDVEDVIVTGLLRRGIDVKNVGELVDQCKRVAAESLYALIEQYFRKINIPLESFRGVVVTGGGALRGGYTSDSGEFVSTSRSVGDYVVDMLSARCSGIVALECDLDSREANTLGLYVMARLNIKRAESFAGLTF